MCLATIVQSVAVRHRCEQRGLLMDAIRFRGAACSIVAITLFSMTAPARSQNFVLDVSNSPDGGIAEISRIATAEDSFSVSGFVCASVALDGCNAVPAVPEPRAYVLLAAGLGIVAWRVCRGRHSSA